MVCQPFEINSMCTLTLDIYNSTYCQNRFFMSPIPQILLFVKVESSNQWTLRNSESAVVTLYKNPKNRFWWSLQGMSEMIQGSINWIWEWSKSLSWCRNDLLMMKHWSTISPPNDQSVFLSLSVHVQNLMKLTGKVRNDTRISLLDFGSEETHSLDVRMITHDEASVSQFFPKRLSVLLSIARGMCKFLLQWTNSNGRLQMIQGSIN